MYDGRIAKDIAAAPNRFDVMAATRSLGEFLAQFADKNVNDLEQGFMEAASYCPPAYEVMSNSVG
jgi:hypothetical protein